jgi:enamine deaminase RidA (YjgF/YER057c/UK114 family)
VILQNIPSWLRATLFKRRVSPGLYIGLLIALGDRDLSAETIRRGTNSLTRGAETVTVTGEALIHTAQFLATDVAGNFLGGNARAQTSQVLDNLQKALAASGSGLSAVVKLNLYVMPGGFVSPVLEVVKQRFPSNAAPAISLVESALPHRDALVAADAVAAGPDSSSPTGVVLYPSQAGRENRGSAQAALLPRGPRIYVSGQAARESDLKQATRAALNLLRQNLEFLGLGISHTVQVKCFIKPMSDVSSVAEIIREFFMGKAPPLVFVEWSNAEPIEIELIAAASKSEHGATKPIQYLTPAGEKASPVFSRIVRVDHPTTIYFSGIYGKGTDGPEEIRSAFDLLGSAAARAGTDIRHLVKATYYVTTDEVGQQLTDIRRKLYDPARPPAASKATVRGTGSDRSVFTMDMIAVPKAGAASH